MIGAAEVVGKRVDTQNGIADKMAKLDGLSREPL
jgi:hypothetical protein